MDVTSPRKSWTRRLARPLGFVAIVALIGAAALPWLLATPPARKAVVAAVNRALAPSRVEIRSVSAGWFGAVRVGGLTLIDRSGKTILKAERASLDRGLLGLALGGRSLGLVTLEGVHVDVERRPDGSIDLVDALVPPTPESGDPAKASASSGGGVSVALRVVRGSARLRTPELAEPVEARSMELEAHYPAKDGKTASWKLRLADPPGGTEDQTFGLDGDYDRKADAPSDLALAVQAHGWPLAASGAAIGADLGARGKLDGAFRARREAGRWSSTGDAVLHALVADGPALCGDTLRLDRVNGIWDLEQSADGWAVRRVELTSPVATVKGDGALDHAPRGRIEAHVDLAAIAKQAPRALRLREGLTLERGGFRAVAELSGDAETQQARVEAKLSELVARDATRRFALGDPAVLDAKATRTKTGFSVETVDLKTAFLNVKGSGDLERGLTVNGTLDLAAIQRQFKDLIDFGAVNLAGQGRMAADFRKAPNAPTPGYVARFAAEVKGLKLVGLSADPIARDLARFDASATGPADASGLPASWENLKVNLKSSRDAVTLAAATRGGSTTWNATAAVPWKLLERDALIDAKFAGRSDPSAIDVQELRVGVRPADPALAADGALTLAVSGRVDLAADTLTLAPLPAAAGARPALAVAPEGLTIKGLRTTPAAERAAKIRLVGDVRAIDRALAVWRASTPYHLHGTLDASAGVTPAADGRLTLTLDVQVPDLARPAPDGKTTRAEGPFRLAYAGDYQPAAGHLRVEALCLATRYATLDAAGKLDEPAGRLVADLHGTLTPHWDALSAFAAESVEPNLRLTGGPRPFRLKGALAAGSLAATLKGLDAELGLDLASADAFGLKLGPAPIVITCGNGAVAIAPIATTLNGGQVTLTPGLDVDEVRGIALTLAEGSSIENAQVNDEVSRRVLRYVAPVLDDATHVNGRVSMTIDRADIPLIAPDDRRLTLTGRLVFQDVVFAPGPFAAEVLTLVGRPDSPGLKLTQPVQLSVADGRVLQKGLEIPIRRDVTVAMEGSVGFDQTLDLRASVPVTRGMLGLERVAQIDELVGGTRVTVPIGGTVKRPRIDRRGLQVALKDLSKGLINRGISRGASELLNRLGPAAEAPPAGAPGAAPAARPAETLEGAATEAVKELGNDVLKRLIPGRRGR